MTGQEAPLVSIGILSYNRPGELRTAVESVLRQSYRNLEILVSDNGSTNAETRAVIAGYAAADARIKPFYHEQNRGPLFNFGFLVGEGTGEYFAWLADDDAYSPNYIADCVKLLSAQPTAVLAACMPVLAGGDTFIPVKHVPDTGGLAPLGKYLRVISYISQDLNIFYYGLIRLDALRQCRYYLKKVFGSDTLLLPELLTFGDIVVAQDRPGYIYTIHADQTSASCLHYKKITLRDKAGFLERNAFFSAGLGFLLNIIRKSRLLTAGERFRVMSVIVSHYFVSKRFHLIKYDLGISRFAAFLKGEGKP